MSFVLDYIALENMQVSVRNNYSMWCEKLDVLSKSIDDLTGSDRMEGESADSLKLYLSTVHNSIISSLSLLCSAHYSKFSTYYNDYIKNIDTELEFYIDSQELDTISSDIQNTYKSIENIDNEITSTLNGISDILTVKRQDLSSVKSTHNQVVKYIDDLKTKINDCEKNHFRNDFEETGTSIKNTKSFINECLNKKRSFKCHFSNDSLISMESAPAFIGSINKINADIRENEDTYTKAIQNADENVNSYNAKLQEEREKKAKVYKWIVGVGCVVASVAVIVATAGTATPLVMGGLGAATGIATSITDDLADSYIENGNLNHINWKEVMIDATVAGVSGFVTGYVGGSFGNWIDGNSLATSSNAIIKSVGKVGTESVKEIVNGELERVSSAIVEESINVAFGDESLTAGLNKIKENAFNPKAIARDAIGGGINGMAGEIVDSATDGLLRKTHLDHKILNNDNKYIRAVGGFTTEGAKGVVKGAEGRFTNSILENTIPDDADKDDINRKYEGKNGWDGVWARVSEAGEDAFDKEKMASDFVKKGTKGATDYTVGNKPVGRKLSKQDLKDPKIMNQIPKDVVSDPKNWMDNKGEIYMDSEGKVTFKAREMKKDNTLLSKKRDVLFYGEDGKPNYERSTVTENQKVYGGHFKKIPVEK